MSLVVYARMARETGVAVDTTLDLRYELRPSVDITFWRGGGGVADPSALKRGSTLGLR